MITHPFVDGNGRTGRLLISLLLMHWNLLPQPLLYLSAYFEKHRQTYYDLLKSVSERGAWHDWVLFFLQGVTEQATDAIRRAKKLQDLRDNWRLELLQGGGSTNLLLLADSLFENPMLNMRYAQRVLNVTHRSAQQNINKLVEHRILEPATQGKRDRVYAARDITDIISEDKG